MMRQLRPYIALSLSALATFGCKPKAPQSRVFDADVPATVEFSAENGVMYVRMQSGSISPVARVIQFRVKTQYEGLLQPIPREGRTAQLPLPSTNRTYELVVETRSGQVCTINTVAGFSAVEQATCTSTGQTPPPAPQLTPTPSVTTGGPTPVPGATPSPTATVAPGATPPATLQPTADPLQFGRSNPNVVQPIVPRATTTALLEIIAVTEPQQLLNETQRAQFKSLGAACDALANEQIALAFDFGCICNGRAAEDRILSYYNYLAKDVTQFTTDCRAQTASATPAAVATPGATPRGVQ